MASHINSITIEGRVARDAEVHGSDTGLRCKFRIGSTERYGDRENTAWVNVTVFGKRAEGLAKLVTKGRLVTVTGRLEVDEVGEGDSRRTFVGVKAHEVSLGALPRSAEDGEPSRRDEPAARRW